MMTYNYCLITSGMHASVTLFHLPFFKPEEGWEGVRAIACPAIEFTRFISKFLQTTFLRHNHGINCSTLFIVSLNIIIELLLMLHCSLNFIYYIKLIVSGHKR